jgi:hypothetical protein
MRALGLKHCPPVNHVQSETERHHWTVAARHLGSVGGAHASFDGQQVLSNPKLSSVSRSGSTVKSLDSYYCAEFAVVLGQAWVETASTGKGVSSKVKIYRHHSLASRN